VSRSKYLKALTIEKLINTHTRHHSQQQPEPLACPESGFG
jgi:hypothetical protein